jgi:hypothetical protein
MELEFKDARAEKLCKGKKEQVVALVHAQLGLASVAEVRSLTDGILHIETHAGSFFVSSDLSRILSVNGNHTAVTAGS